MPITFLIVDDQEIVRKLVCVALKGVADAVFLEAANASQALKVAREYGGAIDLLLTDVSMPGRMNGPEMAALLSQTRPEMKVFLMSGYAPQAVAMQADWSFIQKPFAASEIRETIANFFAENCLAVS